MSVSEMLLIYILEHNVLLMTHEIRVIVSLTKCTLELRLFLKFKSISHVLIHWDTISNKLL